MKKKPPLPRESQRLEYQNRLTTILEFDASAIRSQADVVEFINAIANYIKFIDGHPYYKQLVTSLENWVSMLKVTSAQELAREALTKECQRVFKAYKKILKDANVQLLSEQEVLDRFTAGGSQATTPEVLLAREYYTVDHWIKKDGTVPDDPMRIEGSLEQMHWDLIDLQMLEQDSDELTNLRELKDELISADIEYRREAHTRGVQQYRVLGVIRNYVDSPNSVSSADGYIFDLSPLGLMVSTKPWTQPNIPNAQEDARKLIFVTRELSRRIAEQDQMQNETLRARIKSGVKYIFKKIVDTTIGRIVGSLVTAILGYALFH